MIPGSNLLALALTVIAPQSVQWFAYTGSAIGPTGLNLATYAAPVTLKRTSVQPVNRNRYEAYGLDWNKSYITIYATDGQPLPVQHNPDGDGDVIEWNGRRYQVVGDTPWSALDHWTGLLCVDIGPATGSTTNA